MDLADVRAVAESVIVQRCGEIQREPFIETKYSLCHIISN